MPNNLSEISSYDVISDLSLEKSSNFTVTIIGGGDITQEYAKCLEFLDISNVTIITNSRKDPKTFSNKFNYTVLSGGYEKHVPILKKQDLIIIATPTELLCPACNLCLDYGQNNILLEKPGSLYTNDLKLLNEKSKGSRIRIGLNRLCYPNVHLLKELCKNEILSCKFDFTEWTHKIPMNKYTKDEYRLWGISNSIHLISLAFELIGLPKKIDCFHQGSLDWHPSGSIFTGSGISCNSIPFSYHANWESAGRWMVEIMTKDKSYRLLPIEGLFMCEKGSVDWNPVSFNSTSSKTKPGILEQVIIMLNPNLEKNCPLTTLEQSIDYIKIATKILNY
jgi:predicted dehydrogenase